MSASSEIVRRHPVSQTTVRRKPPLRLQLLVAGAVIALLIVAGSTRLLRSSAPVRAVELNANGIRFNQSNPPIMARVGERLEVTVRNREDHPIAHDFAVPAFGSKTDYLQPGQSETLSFIAEREGSFKYVCTLHPGAMDGLVIVEDR